jgi:hypothetical protein
MAADKVAEETDHVLDRGMMDKRRRGAACASGGDGRRHAVMA